MARAGTLPAQVCEVTVSDRPTASILVRKQPKQARASAVVATILDAAAQVLAREGARRFTTARVAERAGVSVGSLYQYFPNKAAILFRLQSDEWRETTEMLRVILEDGDRTPHERLRRLAGAFVRSECAEAAVRVALDDAAPLYRDAPEAKQAGASATCTIQAFMGAALPNASEAERELAAELVMTTLTEVGKRFSETPRSGAQIDAFADAMGDMLCAYLARIGDEATR